MTASVVWVCSICSAPVLGGLAALLHVEHEHNVGGTGEDEIAALLDPTDGQVERGEAS